MLCSTFASGFARVVFLPEVCGSYREPFLNGRGDGKHKWKRGSWRRAPASCLYLFQPSPLLLLLLDALLPLCQQLPLVLLLLTELLLLQQLLPPKGLGPFLVFLLQPQEITSEGWFSRHIDNGTATKGSWSLPYNEAWWAIKYLFQGRGTLIKYITMLNFNLISFRMKTLDAHQIHTRSGRREMRPSKIRTSSDILEPLTSHICHKSPSIQSSLALSHMRGSFKTFSSPRRGIQTLWVVCVACAHT